MTIEEKYNQLRESVNLRRMPSMMEIKDNVVGSSDLYWDYFSFGNGFTNFDNPNSVKDFLKSNKSSHPLLRETVWYYIALMNQDKMNHKDLSDLVEFIERIISKDNFFLYYDKRLKESGMIDYGWNNAPKNKYTRAVMTNGLMSDLLYSIREYTVDPVIKSRCDSLILRNAEAVLDSNNIQSRLLKTPVNGLARILSIYCNAMSVMSSRNLDDSSYRNASSEVFNIIRGYQSSIDGAFITTGPDFPDPFHDTHPSYIGITAIALFKYAKYDNAAYIAARDAVKGVRDRICKDYWEVHGMVKEYHPTGSPSYYRPYELLYASIILKNEWNFPSVSDMIDLMENAMVVGTYKGPSISEAMYSISLSF